MVGQSVRRIEDRPEGMRRSGGDGGGWIEAAARGDQDHSTSDLSKADGGRRHMQRGRGIAIALQTPDSLLPISGVATT